ncbi:hypothetical protein [Pediococcus stilesii]|uniref:hypothetical protein n=1 Tax=Pediococcus stilesii TaxID=331679 RepID=UPI00070A0E58|nr:hypothetical protein [Pediococcus stilesii]
MKIKVDYHMSIYSKIYQTIILSILWGLIFLFIWLKLLFDRGIINDYLAPLYNLLNIEYTMQNTIFLNILIAFPIILGVAVVRIFFIKEKKNA